MTGGRLVALLVATVLLSILTTLIVGGGGGTGKPRPSAHPWQAVVGTTAEAELDVRPGRAGR